ncbi:1-aminocyclopropane-1-carboxylate synthase [Microdochium trichocladiopsis]|uniref:1-aminocyclopropane-1-carboxylate synthase n=1 Tax=Microdochium trichocladiopsis TaxID=1682393 RepID=A0A9P8YAF9_9PEZI|nr:1-aminocyclopropane-1-carboxylate synthase [Microdochium trichocladiopsis]KAH7037021.1 1-aminocyclopropane-1-carboxylate synthase [Microdochium trichocladiopsis]
MLSRRGAAGAATLDIPWRFAPGANNRYDPVSNPGGVISFATSENALMLDEIHDFAQQHASIPALAYTYRFSTEGGPRFPVAMAAHMNEYFSPVQSVEAEHIITGTGLTAMHELLGFSIADPGDGILVSGPVYGRFELDFGNTSALRMVYANVHGADALAPEVVSSFQEALDTAAPRGVQVKALLIVNPHNPLGRTYPAQTLRAIMAFCEHNSIHLISDEVYALSTYAKDVKFAQGFTSVLSIDPAGLIDTNRLHVLYGMSKDFAAAGLRLGCLVTRNAALRRAVSCNMRFHNPSGLSVAIGTAILEDREFVASFTALSRQRLLSARDYTVSVLAEAGVRCEPANAGFFVFMDLSPWLSPPLSQTANDDERQSCEFALAEKLLDAGVGLHPGEEHAERAGQFRLVFSSHDRETLELGLAR